eukprot:g25113.t1
MQATCRWLESRHRKPPLQQVPVTPCRAPCSGYAAPAPAPVPELPVRQPDRGARWPAAAPVPAGPMPQNTVTVTSATVPSPMPQGPPTVPQPQTLTRAFSVKSGFFRVHWTVDGRKLRGNEKQTVSPPFELSFGPKFPSVTFKMMIYPEMEHGGIWVLPCIITAGLQPSCLFPLIFVRKSKGRGYVQIKCEAELEESVAWVSFRISIGSGSKTVGPRGPRYHNFSQSAEGPTKDEHIWDFTEVLDEASQTFVVCLEIDQLMNAMLLRRNLCAITDDPRWEELPVGLVESILRQDPCPVLRAASGTTSQVQDTMETPESLRGFCVPSLHVFGAIGPTPRIEDDLPIASEAEVLTLIAKWIGDKRKQEDVTRLLRCFRKGDNVRVRIADIAALMQALGWDIFSDKAQSSRKCIITPIVPRKGASVWDPNFAIHREGAGTAQSGPESGERKEGNNVEIIHQMGPKDLMQQEPGWAYPGAHRCRVTLTSTSWSHRERRLLRGGPGQAAALQKRAFEYSPSKPAERSPSPPPSLQVRRPPVDTFETFDIAPMSDGSEQSFLGGAVIRNLTQEIGKE